MREKPKTIREWWRRGTDQFKFAVTAIGILVLFYSFIGAMIVMAPTPRPPPMHSINCWDRDGYGVVISLSDPGSLQIKDGIISYKVGGGQRHVTGNCVVMEIDNE